MFAHPKVWLSLGGLMAVLVTVNIIAWTNSVPVTRAITISMAGYTNLPGNPQRYAFFTVSNQAPYAIRWSGNSVEVRGKPDRWALTVNPQLSAYVGPNPLLGAGRTIIMTVGEPRDLAVTDRWRFAMAYVPETMKRWWLDRCFRDGWPTKIGPVLLVDSQQLLSPSNNIKASSPWLAK